MDIFLQNSRILGGRLVGAIVFIRVPWDRFNDVVVRADRAVLDSRKAGKADSLEVKVRALGSAMRSS